MLRSTARLPGLSSVSNQSVSRKSLVLIRQIRSHVSERIAVLSGNYTIPAVRR